MTQPPGDLPMNERASGPPQWSEVLRALREARGVTQDGWAARLGVSRATVQRWEAGERVPDPGAEAAILAYCEERALFGTLDRGSLVELNLTPQSLQDLLAQARLTSSSRQGVPGRSLAQRGLGDRTGEAGTGVPGRSPDRRGLGSRTGSPSPSEAGSREGTQRSNIPAPLTSFIGREQELAVLRRVQGGTRLFTLTGVGGGGKTRLALRLAGELLWAYPHGVWFAELAALSDPVLVPQTVGASLGLHPAGQQPIVEMLQQHLAERHLLLILDNCEHLLGACAALVERLLRACPHLEVITTSREPLGIIGETVWRVPPLSLADAAGLFVERARLYQPEVTLTAAHAAAIEAVCEQLDGIPLAIELAAARVRALSVEQIAARLSDRFQLLTNGSRTALPRHQTLRGTLDWSHDLLTEPEQVMLRRLSVFAGGCTLEAVASVCGEDDFDPLDLLTSLVDKSLLIAEEQEEAVRYRLLETVRQYAAEKLDAAGETVAARGRHREWYLALAEEAEPALVGPEQAAWLTRLEEEHDNLRAALAWSLTGAPGRSPDRRGLGKGNQPPGRTHDGAGWGRPGSPSPDEEGAAAALCLSGALVRFWERRGHMSEARQWLAQALAAGRSAPADVRAKALRGEGSLAYFQGDYATGRVRLEESLALYRGLGDRRSVAEVQNDLGRVALREGEYTAARDYLEASLAVHVELDHTPGIAGVGSALGLLALRQGDHTTARSFFEAGLALQRKLGNTEGIADALEDLATVAGEQGEHEAQVALLEESLALFYQIRSKGGIALVLGNLGIGAWLQGDAGRATALLRESLSLYREVGDRRGVARLLGNQSFVALSQRDYARAVTLCRESLALYRESGDEWGVSRYLPVLAGVVFAQGQPERAAQLFGAAAALRDRLGTPLPPVVQHGHDRTVGAVRAALGSESFEAAWAVGQALSPEAAVLSVLADAAPA